jgi:molybdopterin/thiamine biosynthesis adenylyltransferase/rhodanese-related sulfurtransferase
MHVHSTRVSASSSVSEITAEELAAWLDGEREPPIVVDVREPHEVAAGSIARAWVSPLSAGLDDLVRRLPDGAHVVLVCARGERAKRAQSLIDSRRYASVAVLRGGMAAWEIAGRPSVRDAALDGLDARAFDRQMRLPEVGPHGQAKLARSRVAVVGAGGLGCPVLLYLAAAGVGQLTVVDFDTVAIENLHRQVLYGPGDVGRPKVSAAAAALARLHPHVRVAGHVARFGDDTAHLLEGHDLVVDATDSFGARSAVNRAALAHRIPAVLGAVSRFEGEVLTHLPGSPCYACLHPEPPAPGLSRSCSEEGVLGVVPGIVGLLQANEVLKVLLGIGEPLAGRLLTFDARSARFLTLRLERDAACPACSTA